MVGNHIKLDCFDNRIFRGICFRYVTFWKSVVACYEQIKAVCFLFKITCWCHMSQSEREDLVCLKYTWSLQLYTCYTILQFFVIWSTIYDILLMIQFFAYCIVCLFDSNLLRIRLKIFFVSLCFCPRFSKRYVLSVPYDRNSVETLKIAFLSCQFN